MLCRRHLIVFIDRRHLCRPHPSPSPPFPTRGTDQTSLPGACGRRPARVCLPILNSSLGGSSMRCHSIPSHQLSLPMFLILRRRALWLWIGRTGRRAGEAGTAPQRQVVKLWWRGMRESGGLPSLTISFFYGCDSLAPVGQIPDGSTHS